MDASRYCPSRFASSPCPRASALVLLAMDMWLAGRLIAPVRAQVCRLAETRAEAALDKAAAMLRPWARCTPFASAPSLAEKVYHEP